MNMAEVVKSDTATAGARTAASLSLAVSCGNGGVGDNALEYC